MPGLQKSVTPTITGACSFDEDQSGSLFGPSFEYWEPKARPLDAARPTVFKRRTKKAVPRSSARRVSVPTVADSVTGDRCRFLNVGRGGHRIDDRQKRGADHLTGLSQGQCSPGFD